MRSQDLTLFTNPTTFLRRFTTDMERFFDAFATSRPFAAETPLPDPRFVPNVDIVEKDGVLAIRADLPGLTKKDISVEITDEMLTIKGERKTDLEETKDGVYRMERTYGSFYRAFPMPQGVKPEDVKATFANGVLELTMPLPTAAQAVKPRKIDVIEPAPEKADKAKTAA
jgi:HSP20 family protein